MYTLRDVTVNDFTYFCTNLSRHFQAWLSKYYYNYEIKSEITLRWKSNIENSIPYVLTRLQYDHVKPNTNVCFNFATSSSQRMLIITKAKRSVINRCSRDFTKKEIKSYHNNMILAVYSYCCDIITENNPIVFTFLLITHTASNDNRKAITLTDILVSAGIITFRMPIDSRFAAKYPGRMPRVYNLYITV